MKKLDLKLRVILIDKIWNLDNMREFYNTFGSQYGFRSGLGDSDKHALLLALTMDVEDDVTGQDVIDNLSNDMRKLNFPLERIELREEKIL